MPLTYMNEFLEHEKENFLKPAWEAARASLDAWEPGSVEREMWQGWADYFQVLIEENEAMRGWVRKDYEQTLPALIDAMRELEAVLAERLADLKPDAPARAPIANFAELMRIERIGKTLMLAEAKA